MNSSNANTALNDALADDLMAQVETQVETQVEAAVSQILHAQQQAKAWGARAEELKATTRPLLDGLYGPHFGTVTLPTGRARLKQFERADASATTLIATIGELVAAKKITGAVAMRLQEAISTSALDYVEFLEPLETAPGGAS